MGKKLDSPKIAKPESIFVRELEWQQPRYATNYDFVLSHLNPQTKLWKPVKSVTNYQPNKMDFLAEWPGGRWQLQVKAKADGRESSDNSVLEFLVINGIRTVEAENLKRLRESIDRAHGWYGTAGYDLALLNYKSLVEFNMAIGGTARLEIAWLSKAAWGFHSQIEMSFFSAEKQFNYFNSYEATAVYRKPVLKTDELRFPIGLGLRELPVLVTPEEYSAKLSSIQNGSTYNQTVAKISSYGPKLGVEYLHSVTPKLSLQLNSQVFYSFMAATLPSGATGSSPELSYQLGSLAGYRLTPRLTSLLGVSYRASKLTYSDDFGSKSTSKGIPTNITTSITGLYVNCSAEYLF